MRRIFFAAALVFASVSTALSGTTDPMAAVRQCTSMTSTKVT